MIVVPKFYVSDRESVVIKENSPPPWHSLGTGSPSTWWYGPDNTDFFYHISNSGDSYTIFVQYGQDKPAWASARFFVYSIVLKSEQKDDNNNLTINFDFLPLYFKGMKKPGAGGNVRVVHTLSYRDSELDRYEGDTADTFTLDLQDKKRTNESVTIAPKGYTTATGLAWRTRYPDGQYENRELVFGLSLENPLEEFVPEPEPELYVPMSLRKSGLWKSLNKNNGEIYIRRSGVFNKLPHEDLETSRKANTGHSRGRKGGVWIQLPPMD